MAQIQVIDLVADIAQIVRKAPTTTLVNAYVRAARKFCRESRWFRSTLVGQTVVGTQLYSLGTDPYLEVLGLAACSLTPLTGNLQTVPLTAGDPGGWNPDILPNTPQWYAYIPEGQIAVYPIPNAVFTLTMTLVLQPKLGVNSVPSEILVKWDQALQAGALGYLLDIPGQPWSNPQQAALRKREFQSGISNARADEARGFNAGSVFARRRPFIVGRR